MNVAARAFSSDYVTARARFREAAKRARFDVVEHPIGQLGPNGDELTIDVATRGPFNATRALVISSGLHGIEGFFGSAVQWTWLEQHTSAVTPDKRVVLIHALNPYGFAHRRRVNEDNVDLNRNFVLNSRYEGADPAYRMLDTLLNPEQPPGRVDTFWLRTLPKLAQHGFKALKNAVAQGQYEYPRGLFFGGQAPSTTSRILQAELPGWLGRPDHVIHLDLHTGRGSWGTYALCVDLPVDGVRVAHLRKNFGIDAVEAFDPNGVLYEIRGALGPWLEQLMPHARYDCLLAEFGTNNALSVLQALRTENAVHQFGAQDIAQRERAKALMMNAFCPSSAKWRSQVLASGLRVIGQALRMSAN